MRALNLMIGERNILCIDWDERSLRLLDARLARSRLRIAKAVHVPLPDDVSYRDPVSMGLFLKRTLVEHRIRTRRAIVDVPRQDVVLNLMSLPKGSIDEMSAMVHVQAAKELPFANDQAVIDYAVVREREGGMCEVWVAAVRTAVLDRYQQVIAGAGLKLERVGLRPYANVASLVPDEIADQRTLMVDIGPGMTEICVIDSGRLVFSRAASVSIPREGLASSPEKPAVEKKTTETDDAIPFIDDRRPRVSPVEMLLIEVSRTVEAYRATSPGSTIDQIVLAGMMESDRSLVERFEERFGAPCRVYEMPSNLRWPGSSGEKEAAFSVVIGLAISTTAEGSLFFDFLHPKEPEAGQRVRQRQRPLLVATVAVFVGAAGLIAYSPIRHRKGEIARLQAIRTFKNENKDDRKEMLSQFKDYQAWQGKNVIWIDELMRLADAFPGNKEAYITKLEFNDKGKITVELAAKDEMVATMIVDKVAEIKDKKGQSVFTAKPGKDTDSTDNEYPVKDQVFIELESLAGQS